MGIEMEHSADIPEPGTGSFPTGWRVLRCGGAGSERGSGGGSGLQEKAAGIRKIIYRGHRYLRSWKRVMESEQQQAFVNSPEQERIYNDTSFVFRNLVISSLNPIQFS
jgi:hypothetical protein